MQQRLNPGREPKVERYGWRFACGDKVIQMINNYYKDVYNGDIGSIVSVDLEAGKLAIDYDGRQVDY